MKVCCRCKEFKDIFYPDKRAKDGKCAHCPDCEKVSRAVRKDAIKKTKSAYYFANKDEVLKRNSNYRIKNVLSMRRYRAKWRKNNKNHCAALRAKSRAARRLASPPWLTQCHLDAILAVYVACPAGHEVDHIIPIQGKNVCGLHVPWNLQHLTLSENRRKGNKVEDV